MKPPCVDVIVVNYRTPADLQRFLDSMWLGGPERIGSLHIANVCPTPEDDDVALRYCVSRPWVTFTSITENIGFNRAVNRAGQFGLDDVIAVFNADIVLSEGAIDAVASELMAHEDWAIAGPRQVDERGRLVAAGIFNERGQPRHRGWHEKAERGAHQDVRDDCASVCGSAFFIKRVVWEELTRCPIYRNHFPNALGPMGKYLHYYGDESCSWLARAHGYRLGYVGTVTITHRHMGAGRPSPDWTSRDRRAFEGLRDDHPESACAS